MTDQAAPAPLTDDQLRAYRERLSDAMHRNGQLYLTTDAPHAMLRLLDEVDRLRALLATVRTNQVGLARAYAETSTRAARRAGKFEWTPAHSAAYAQGEARGAVHATQCLLMELGEVEYDEAAETTWDLVMSDKPGAES